MKTALENPKAAPASKSASTTKKTTVDLDADTIAKIRSSLRAIGSKQTLEEFCDDTFADMLQSISGVFEGLIQWRHEHRRAEIEAVLDRIRRGDKRLVRWEPLPRNVTAYRNIMERLEVAASADPTGYHVNSLMNSLLDYALGKFERGEIHLCPTSPTEGAA